MRSPEQIRSEIDRQLRRLAQAYLYGTEAEQERLKLVLQRLQAEERRMERARVFAGAARH